MKVLVVRQRLAERIRGRFPEEIEIVTPPMADDEELVNLVVDVDIILATRLSPEVASAAGNLRLLQKTGAGDRSID